MLKDPVFGMNVAEQFINQMHQTGQLFYFCSANCRAKFSADSESIWLNMSAHISKCQNQRLL